jgi:hypothetical protein
MSTLDLQSDRIFDEKNAIFSNCYWEILGQPNQESTRGKGESNMSDLGMDDKRIIYIDEEC